MLGHRPRSKQGVDQCKVSYTMASLQTRHTAKYLMERKVKGQQLQHYIRITSHISDWRTCRLNGHTSSSIVRHFVCCEWNY